MPVTKNELSPLIREYVAARTVLEAACRGQLPKAAKQLKAFTIETGGHLAMGLQFMEDVPEIDDATSPKQVSDRCIKGDANAIKTSTRKVRELLRDAGHVYAALHHLARDGALTGPSLNTWRITEPRLKAAIEAVHPTQQENDRGLSSFR